MSKLSPVKLSPVFKDYIWGGNKLKKEYNKKSDLDSIAESWELAFHKDGQSVVASGEYVGLQFGRYLSSIGQDYSFGFPLLIKLIDAKDNLSVQVHPDDKFASEHEGEKGKTEMWYVLDCEEGAFLYYGFSEDITKEEYMAAIKNNTILHLLNKVYVHKGDVFFIPSGTVHAIGGGITICEIQENSNTTYRVYDYNRKDKFGNSRQLHIEKALMVTTLTKTIPFSRSDSVETLAKCPYFTVRKADISESRLFFTSSKSFQSVIITEGSGKLIMNETHLDLNKGDSVFIPAQDGNYEICGGCEAIVTTL
jgi:mannose-6-phosphate isomerase